MTVTLTPEQVRNILADYIRKNVSNAESITVTQFTVGAGTLQSAVIEVKMKEEEKK